MILKLTYGSNQALIRKSFDKKLPRVRVNPGTAEYNLNGTAVLRGSQFEPKFLWTVSALMTTEEYAALQLIYGLSDLARRSQGNPAIVLDDLTEPISETTRTRAIADTTIEQTIPGGGLYYAKFKVIFVKPPEAVEIAEGYQTNFVLAELDRVAP